MTRGSALNLSRRTSSPPEEEEDVRAGVNASTPNIARMYDYLLGGKDNYAADREAAEQALLKAPVVSRLAQTNRAFVGHAAGLLAEAGLRRFLDIGCGLPAAESVADVVRRTDPSCRVAYIDNDPMVLTHARALLAVDAGTIAVAADLRDPAALLARPELREVIGLDRPVGVLLLDVLHFLTDADDPHRVMDELLAGLAPGSHVAVTHAERTPELEAAAGIYANAGHPLTPRSREEIAEICGCLEMLDPYPAHLPLAQSAAVPLIGCLGRKPE